MNNLKELQDEIGRTHKQLLDAMDREKKSNEANSQLLKEISSMRSELESSREENVRLNADLYKSYREYEDILNSYRSEMKEKVMDSKNSAEDQFGELVENSILEQKGITDFMNSLPNREGWLSKMKKTGTFKSAYKPVRRYFAIRGDTLYYSKKKIGSSTNLPNIHSVKLKYFKMINIGLQGPLEENTADIRRHSMLSTKTSIEIYPDESKKNNPAKKLILGPILVLGELPQDVYDWAQDINDRIALISYLTSMEEKAKLTGRTQGCREIVNYICERSSSLLKIENKVPIDLFNALVHFKQSLMSRKGLSIYLSNAGIPDSVCEILAEIVEQNYTMRAMVLSKNLISDEGVERLAKAIKANLQFSAIDLEKNNIGDSGISALGEAIETHRMISRINLSYNAITDAGIKKFAQSMIRNVETHKNVLDFPVLELDGNKIGDEGAIAIAKLCKINQAITSVQLNKNMITDTGAMALAEAIQNGSGITDLQLADNQVSSKGASAIAQAIYKCGRAVTVDLSFNKLIGRKGFSAYFGVETPISMEKFKITMNTVDQELGRK